MICFALRASKEDLLLLQKGIKDEMARSTDETSEVVFIRDLSELEEFLKKKENIDVVCVDVSLKDGIEMAEIFRREYANAIMMVIADIGMSPMLYMKPQIMAATLALKPLDAAIVKNVMQQLFAFFLNKEESKEMFVVENRDEKIRVPYDRILYFEARMKKIYVCTESREYGFYDTMDHLEELLGTQFTRCHRGYMVNTSYVKNVLISQGIITLKDDIEIPLSRSYKSAFKDVKMQIDL